MNNFEELVSKKIGKTIKRERLKQNISQKELAAGICSQAMISSIEHGDYIPNTAIFLALCQKLNLSIDQNFLKEKLPFNNSTLTDTAFDLCSKHKYRELIKYLSQQPIISSLNNDQDFQNYYYYYGCAVYQIEHDLLDCRHYFELAITYSMNIDIDHLRPKNSIEFLLINSLGVIYAELHKTKEASRLFEIVNKQILSCRDAESENLNVIRYQQGCIFLKQKDYQSALKSFAVGLDRVNNLNSTFMLNNYSAKILECYQSLT